MVLKYIQIRGTKVLQNVSFFQGLTAVLVAHSMNTKFNFQYKALPFHVTSPSTYCDRYNYALTYPYFIYWVHVRVLENFKHCQTLLWHPCPLLRWNDTFHKISGFFTNISGTRNNQKQPGCSWKKSKNCKSNFVRSYLLLKLLLPRTAEFWFLVHQTKDLL